MNSSDGEKFSLMVEALRAKIPVKLKAQGASMMPTLWPGDLIAVQAFEDTPRVGDVVLAVREGRCFTHRLVRRVRAGSTHWITCGDAMPHSDPPFESDQLLGKVMAVERGGKTRPIRRLTIFVRAVGLLFCYSNSVRNLALRLHQSRTHRRTLLGQTA